MKFTLISASAMMAAFMAPGALADDKIYWSGRTLAPVINYDQALNIAYSQGLNRVKKIELDDEEWEIEGWMRDGREFEIEIDARTGRVMEMEID